MEIIDRKISEIIPYDKNPRINNNAVDKTMVSIKEFGFQQPIVVDKAGIVIAGHTRLKAAVKLGMKTCPVIVAENLSDAQIKAYRIADNKTGELATWDQDLLVAEIGDLVAVDFDIELTGFDLSDFDLDKKPGLTDEDDVPEVKESIVKLGDLWALGEHRLLCGDSTDIKQVERLMDGKKADMVFTDPPYGVDYDGGIQFTKEGVKKGQRVKLENDHSDDIYSDVIPILAKFCNGPCYVWFAGTKASKLYDAVESVGDIHSLLIWVKNGGYGALNANYKQKHEPCLYWKPKGKKLNFVGATTETTIWNINKDGVNKLHPTQKPVELSEKAIMNHSAGLVLDTFLGSGSTLIACEKTNRKCYGMELDPHYCDVIVKRWEEYIGQTAVLKEK